jgi:hypothetical protein
MTVPEPGRRPRWLVPAAAAVLVVLVALVVTILVVAKGGDGPADQFEAAAKTFADTYTPAAADVGGKMTGRFGDSSLGEAQQDARKISAAYDAYGKALGAITFPDGAKPAVADLVKATEAGKLVWVNAAGFFSGSAMKALLDNYRPQVEASVTKAEEALRTALKD